MDGGLEDASIGFSARLKLGPVAMQGSSTPAPKPISLSSVGLMIGHPDVDMMFPSQIVFHPYLVVRNTTGEQRTISVAANYQFGTAASTVPLLSLNLAPYATQRVDVESAILQLGLNRGIGYVNLVYGFTGASSDLLVSAGSIDGAGNYVFETPASPNQPSMARTLCYWQMGDGFDTMFTIYNYGATAEDLVLALSFDGGTYKLPIHLDPGASTMLDMEDIVARQTPDADGNTIPAGVVEGSAKLSGSRGELQHIRAAVSAASYNPSKATCNVRCIDCAVTLYVEFAPTPAFASMAVGKTQQMTIMGRTKGGTQYNTTAVGTWTSLNSNVATVGTGASQPGLVTAMSVGATSVSYDSPPVQLVLEACGDPPECEDGEPITVDMPTSITPTIASVSPQPLVYGTAAVMTIAGSGFSPGTATVSSSSGSINFGTANVNGGTITVPYTVTCSETVGSDSIIVTVNSSDGPVASDPYSVTVVFPNAPVPTFTFNGSAVSGTQSAVVGQPIGLKANVAAPNCMSVSTQSWGTPTGSPIGNYVVSTPSASVTNYTASTTGTQNFYWAYPSASGTPWTETYQYTMTAQSGGNVSGPSATLSFNVSGPTGGSMTATSYTNVEIANLSACPTSAAGPWLAYGVLSGSCALQTGTPPGMFFYPPSGYQNSTGGTFSLVQLISSDNYSLQTVTGIPSTTTMPSGLDTKYPYPQTLPATDSPKTALFSGNLVFDTLTRSFTANMFLLWTSTTVPNAIPVPLGYISWGFSGTANCIISCSLATSWSTITLGTPGQTGGWTASSPSQTSAGNNILSNGYPTWTAVSQ